MKEIKRVPVFLKHSVYGFTFSGHSVPVVPKWQTDGQNSVPKARPYGRPKMASVNKLLELIFLFACFLIRESTITSKLFINFWLGAYLTGRWDRIGRIDPTLPPSGVDILHWSIGCLCEAYRHPYFCSDADFDRKYLRNGFRYRQAENGIITHDSSRVGQKNLVNFGPLAAQLHCLQRFWKRLSVCLSVCISVHGHRSALGRACAAAAACYLYVTADGWRVAAAVTLPVFPTPVSVCSHRLFTSWPCSAANAFRPWLVQVYDVTECRLFGARPIELSLIQLFKTEQILAESICMSVCPLSVSAHRPRTDRLLLWDGRQTFFAHCHGNMTWCWQQLYESSFVNTADV